MQITPVSNALGATVSDIALDELTDDEAAQLVDAWSEYGVLFFRDQHLTPDQHKAFARRFGDIDINRFFNAVDGHPEIAEVLGRGKRATESTLRRARERFRVEYRRLTGD